MNFKKSDKYKHVYRWDNETSVNAVLKWHAKVCKNQKHFKTEREAAIWADLALIEQGKEPVNILVRKVKSN